MWVTSLGLAGEAGIFASLPFYPMFSGVPNGLLRLSPPQVHAAVHNSGVRPFPKGQGRWRISTNGARQARWRRDGKELFYIEEDTLVAVGVKTQPTFSVGSVERLFESTHFQDSDSHVYDVSADGQRFIIPEPLEEEGRATIRVVQNWFAEFKDQQGRAE